MWITGSCRREIYCKHFLSPPFYTSVCLKQTHNTSAQKPSPGEHPDRMWPSSSVHAPSWPLRCLASNQDASVHEKFKRATHSEEPLPLIISCQFLFTQIFSLPGTSSGDQKQKTLSAKVDFLKNCWQDKRSHGACMVLCRVIFLTVILGCCLWLIKDSQAACFYFSCTKGLSHQLCNWGNVWKYYKIDRCY